MKETNRKIGILTFHCSNNYGAVLQAYALRTVLQELYPNKEVNVINYRCKGTITPTSFNAIKHKKGFVRALLHYRQIQKMNNKFDDFRRKRLNLTSEYFNHKSLAKDIDKYDTIVSGSDQVWNLKWSDGDSVYFQTFHNQDEKKVSYAASFGFTDLDTPKVDLYKKYLEHFKKISVREESAKSIVEDRLGLKACCNLDPTLLLDKSVWNQIAVDPKIKEKYILVYMVPKQFSIINKAIELRKKTGLPIVVISKNLRPVNVRHKGDSSPDEFVGWFKNAEYIVTNSFHGTAFSCIYKKNLWIDLKTERGFNTRSESLLRLCNLIHTNDCVVSITSGDWEESASILDNEKEKAKNYLRNLI